MLCETRSVKTSNATWDPLPQERAEFLGRLSDAHAVNCLRELSDKALGWLHAMNSSGPWHFMLYDWHDAENEPDLPFFDEAQCHAMLEIAKDIVHNLCVPSDATATLLSVRLLVSSPGSCAQHWHLDHPGANVNAQTVFVAVTPCTTDNCTEVLAFDIVEDERTLLHAATVSDSEGRLPNLDLDDFAGRYKVVPITMEPLEVCRIATTDTLHRRGCNRSDYTRVVLSIDYTAKEKLDMSCCLALPSWGSTLDTRDGMLPSWGSTLDTRDGMVRREIEPAESRLLHGETEEVLGGRPPAPPAFPTLSPCVSPTSTFPSLGRRRRNERVAQDYLGKML